MRYPLTLTNLGGGIAIVFGGGIVGERKVRSLLAADVQVRLISPSATRQLTAWAEGGELEWTQRPYQDGDLADAGLVFAATNVRAVNHEIAAAAHKQGLLVNVADSPAEGNFHSPAVMRRDDLIVSVSTNSGRPRRATAARDRIAALLETEE
ncbi:MAG: bifunctional precorrin-2 dehydrogenase/sirohydrochlorin ferrochelatase [Caldilineaceae bacterium]|nr:bifunctional precorrin-2 dehydrogenase/sirohydrochlorin ferrochelatase [Caldilineaceae bacterium]